VSIILITMLSLM